MNPEAILALIGDLYTQIAALTTENRNLREQITAPESATGDFTAPDGVTLTVN